MPFRSSSSSFSSHSYSSPSRSSSFSSFRSTTRTIQTRPPAVGTVTAQRAAQLHSSTWSAPHVTVFHASAMTVYHPYHPGYFYHPNPVFSCDLFHPFSPCSAWAPWSIWHHQVQTTAMVGQASGYVPQQYQPGTNWAGVAFAFAAVAAIVCLGIHLFNRRQS